LPGSWKWNNNKFNLLNGPNPGFWSFWFEVGFKWFFPLVNFFPNAWCDVVDDDDDAMYSSIARDHA